MKHIYISTTFLRSNTTSAIQIVLSRFSMDNLETHAVLQVEDDREWLRESGWMEQFDSTATAIPEGVDAVVVGNDLDFVWCSLHPTARKARKNLMDALSYGWQFSPTSQDS